MMHGFKFLLEGLYFTTFRKPTSTSTIITYSIPPFTTIRGLISNALNLRRDDLKIQEWIKIGIKPLAYEEKTREMAKILKLKGDGKEFVRTFPSAPMFKEFLVNPSYEIYIGGNEDKVKTIHNALKNPARPLYIGASDELVDIVPSELLAIEKKISIEVSSIAEGVHENAIVEKIPFKFHQKGKNFSLEYKTVSIPKNEKLKLEEAIEAYRFGDEIIWLG